MLRPVKIIATFFLTCFYFTSLSSQTTSNTETNNADTSYYRLQVYRQIFWDSLPKPIGWTNDYENLFTDEQEDYFDSLISSFKNKTSVEICIVTLDTTLTAKELFDDLALHIANTWGVGQKEKNNGVTICISKGYRRIRICNGYGIEKYLTDNDTKIIIDKYFIPSFKNNNYYEGTLNGLKAIISKLSDKMK